MEVNGNHNIFAYQHSSKYIIWAQQKKKTQEV